MRPGEVRLWTKRALCGHPPPATGNPQDELPSYPRDENTVGETFDNHSRDADTKGSGSAPQAQHVLFGKDEDARRRRPIRPHGARCSLQRDCAASVAEIPPAIIDQRTIVVAEIAGHEAG